MVLVGKVWVAVVAIEATAAVAESTAFIAVVVAAKLMA